MMFILFVVVPSPLNSPTQSLNLEWGLERENWEIDMLFTPPGRRSAASMSRQGALPLAYRTVANRTARVIQNQLVGQGFFTAARR